MIALSRPVACALGAALLFGASTPLAKPLAGELAPLLLAGLLYLGSGVGLAIFRAVFGRAAFVPRMPAAEWRWFGGAIIFGGVLGPALLMTGLALTSAGTASLLLNLESVLTAVIAWVVFRENADRRIVLGMLAIVAGGVVLAWSGSADAAQGLLGPGAVALACLCWAIDNNLTRKVSANDAAAIAMIKGLFAGTVNAGLAIAAGAAFPPVAQGAAAMAVGLFGYGVSLVLFVLALRGLGAARTGAYFSTAPFIGAALSLVLLGESTSTGFWIAGALMAIGVWLHLTERHAHTHVHEPMEHEHPHRHDEHHRHEHDFDWDGKEPHTHPHAHERMEHSHDHYPDIHHQHRH